HVLIVVALGNRQVALHTGPRLRDDLGLTGPALEEALAAPVFAAGAPPSGLPRRVAALVEAIDARIRQADGERQRARKSAGEQARGGRARVGTLLGAERGALDAAEAEITRQGRAGLAVQPLEQEATAVAALLEQAQLLARAQPAAATQSARTASTRRLALQQALAGLEQQHAATLALRDQTRQRLGAARQALETARRASLSVTGPHARVRQTEEALRRADHLLALDDAAAEQVLREASTLAEGVTR